MSNGLDNSLDDLYCTVAEFYAMDISQQEKIKKFIALTPFPNPDDWDNLPQSYEKILACAKVAIKAYHGFPVIAAKAYNKGLEEADKARLEYLRTHHFSKMKTKGVFDIPDGWTEESYKEAIWQAACAVGKKQIDILYYNQVNRYIDSLSSSQNLNTSTS